jgi:predicted HTH domain antitoxin
MATKNNIFPISCRNSETLNFGKTMQNSTLHIKVKPELAKGLKALARKRETSVGELVRQAVISCYQIDIANLSEKQRRAVEAFQGGYISQGKLAEEMGMNIWNTRKWLIDHDIPQNNSFFENDVKNA